MKKCKCGKEATVTFSLRGIEVHLTFAKACFEAGRVKKIIAMDRAKEGLDAEGNDCRRARPSGATSGASCGRWTGTK